MLATRWSDVDDLNVRARTHLHNAGRLTGPTLTVEDRPYQAGDRIMTLRNDRRLHVRNGTCALITEIDAERRDMTVRSDAGMVITLPARYVDAGHVRHAYATTIHKAQGQTVDRAFVLGSDLLYQEAGYVALSRGRSENRIYLVDREPREEQHAPEAAPPEPLDALTQALAVSRAQHLALDAGIDRHAIGREVRAAHARTRPLARGGASLPTEPGVRDRVPHNSTRTDHREPCAQPTRTGDPRPPTRMAPTRRPTYPQDRAHQPDPEPRPQRS